MKAKSGYRPFLKNRKPLSHKKKFRVSIKNRHPLTERKERYLLASDTAWNSVVEEIKEVCRLYCLRNHDFQTEKNIQTGEEFLIISFYHVKKMVSPETLEILNADTIRRLEQLGYTNNRSYYKGFSFIIEVEGKTTAEQKDKKSLAEDTPLGIQSQESEEMTPGELKEMNIRDRFSLWRQRIMSIFKGIPILHFKNTDPILQ